jgi:predicted secreted protein
MGTGANKTYIERNASGQTVWGRGQGEFVYNGSSTKYEDNGLTDGITYYYQAWSFTTWTYNPVVSHYSDDNDSDKATTPQVDISIGVTPSTWDQGTILIGSSNATTGFYFNLTNQGSVPIIVQIKATNATNATTGAKWNLTGSSGLNNFSFQYNKSGDVSWTTINLTYDTFVLNLPATGTDWKTFDLNLIMATSSSTGDPLSFSITFKSVVA